MYLEKRLKDLKRQLLRIQVYLQIKYFQNIFIIKTRKKNSHLKIKFLKIQMFAIKK